MKAFLLAIALVAASADAWAMGKEGHGGAALVRRDAGGSITWARLLDLWEGEARLGLAYQQAGELEPESVLARAESRIPSAFLPTYLGALVDVRRAFRFLKDDPQWLAQNGPDAVLPPTEDYFSPDLPVGSRYEQLALFRPFGPLHVDERIHDVLPRADQAGLLVHEAVYKSLRERAFADNSQAARVLTALLMADDRGDAAIAANISDFVRFATTAPDPRDPARGLRGVYLPPGSPDRVEARLGFYQDLRATSLAGARYRITFSRDARGRERVLSQGVLGRELLLPLPLRGPELKGGTLRVEVTGFDGEIGAVLVSELLLGGKRVADSSIAQPFRGDLAMLVNQYEVR
jgi:hypothetical protein